MLIKSDVRLMVLVTTMALFLGACAGNQLKVEPIARSENPIEHYNRLDNDVSNARKNQINVLSPTWFAKAETSLKEAKELLDRGGELSKVSKKIADGRAQLGRAEEMAKLARTALPDSIKARELARAAGAVRLGRDYSDVEEKFLQLTKAIENNNLLWARKKESKVTKAFVELELRAIKKQTLGEVRRLIAQAEEENAQKVAPKTLALAQEKFAEADMYISSHRYEKETIHKRAGEALFHARRLVQVTRQSQKLQTMQPEQITLWVEEILHKPTSKLSAPDMRDRTFDMQVENIVGSIATLQADHEFMTDRVRALENEIQTMETQIASLEGQTLEEKAEKDRLAEEKWFNELFTEVQSYFRPDEAEVYKQGNQLVIRLKAMQFPVGKDFIMPSSYGLLSKVQKAIRTFGEPKIVIEGHTDSTGSDAMNEHLSQQRADAVRQYFVANGILGDEKIVSVGYGSKRPLASNKTPEGRAINRRIDLVIVPSMRTVF
ncbi:MAG: OmpA family protein [Proteobacteria bacterium]|nr:OmpA family protein [Pseudomonadota bacterium]